MREICQRLRDLVSFRFLLGALCLLSGSGLFISRIVEVPERSALRGWDNSFYVMWARSVVFDGDIHFANELEINNTFAEEDREAVQKLPLTETGYIENKYGIGWGLVSLPIYFAADGLVGFVNMFLRAGFPRDGYHWVYQVCLQLGHLVYALIGLFYAYRLCSIWVDRESAWLAVMSMWGGSMLLYYQALNLSMAHSLVFSLVALIYYYSARLWECPQAVWKPLAAIFTASGLLVVTRYQACVYLLFPAVAIIRLLLQRQRRAWLPIGMTFLLALIPVLLQLFAWKTIYGRWLVFTYGEKGEGFNWSDLAAFEVLFSPNHGLFYWHPLLVVGAIFFIAWAILERKPALWWAVSAIVTYFVNAAWWCWWLGSSFGHRNSEALVLFFMCGMAYALSVCRSRSSVLLGLKTIVILAVVWNVNLAILYATNVISRNSAVTWSEMLQGSVELYSNLF